MTYNIHSLIFIFIIMLPWFAMLFMALRYFYRYNKRQRDFKRYIDREFYYDRRGSTEPIVIKEEVREKCRQIVENDTERARLREEQKNRRYVENSSYGSAASISSYDNGSSYDSSSSSSSCDSSSSSGGSDSCF